MENVPKTVPVSPRRVDPSAPYDIQPNLVHFTIFVACYNEEENILPTLEEVTAALTTIGRSWEIIVIDDASRDRSVELVADYMRRHPGYDISLYVREVNQGLAQNYIEGAFLGKGTYYKLVCGDNVATREDLIAVLSHAGEAAMILPYIPEDRGRSLFRRRLSKSFTSLVNTISGHHVRYYNGVGINLRYNVMRWHTNYHGFSFQADLTTRLLDQGFDYIEIPIPVRERVKGSSKALTLKNFLSVAHFFMDLFIRRVGGRHKAGGAPIAR